MGKTLNTIIMKKRFFAYMLALTAVVSVTSGCVVREGGYDIITDIITAIITTTVVIN